MDCKSNVLSYLISFCNYFSYNVYTLKCDRCNNTYLLGVVQEVENFIHKRVYVIVKWFGSM